MRQFAALFQFLSIALCVLTLQGCKIDSIINGTVANGAPNPATTLGWSEAGAFTPDGKFFIIGGKTPLVLTPSGLFVSAPSAIFEVIKNANGSYSNLTVVEGNVAGNLCYFGSMIAVRFTLYATCTNISGPVLTSVLYRVDLTKAKADPRRVMTAPLMTQGFQPNGMAADLAGNLYIPNSAAFIASFIYGMPNVPAIVKVKITDDASFRISETPWLPAALGGFAPNGVAIQGNQLYLPSLNIIYRVPMLADGTAGMPSKVYEGAKTNMFDNVTLLPGNLLAVPEISNPDPGTIEFVYPGTPPATTVTSQITLVDLFSGKSIGVAKFPAYARPSSITPALGLLFPPGSAIVTDAIGAGGLYTLKP